ncbi:hypothetical protein AJ79_01071 [Helicocarpus griseus UAMH5409]|uniref:Wax synthase domain-containing protein n=1 Tax=Helicocarpus griseus UAMH5409 TaxID=1447875 RepID=A0A2B7Y8T9_9EURO|nr:hypothetical protein AJ79_01071 [Helicocarpus griseus UAMH5409]
MEVYTFVPYVSVALSLALQGLTLIYVSPTSYKRAFALPVILLPVAITYFTAEYASAIGICNVFIAVEFSSMFAVEVFDNVCLSKKSYAPAVQAQLKKDDDAKARGKHFVSKWNALWDKACWSLDIAVNKRRINRVDQARNIPYFDSKRPHYYPSRRNFLLFRTTRFVLLYLLLDFVMSQPLEDAQVKFAPGKERIFARILERDIVPAELGEIFGILVGQAICYYGTLLAGYDFLSLVSVGLCMGNVSDWRPLFGDIREVYTIRTFWRTFWHQQLLRPLESTASFITHSLLRLPRITRIEGISISKPRLEQKILYLLSSYTTLTLIFLISGIAHIISDRMIGIPYRDTRIVSLFLSQAVGIMFEDAGRWIYRCVTGSKREGPVKIWHRVVGYAWLVVFALWAVPEWVFSILRLEEQPVMLPVTFFEKGKGAVRGWQLVDSWMTYLMTES